MLKSNVCPDSTNISSELIAIATPEEEIEIVLSYGRWFLFITVIYISPVTTASQCKEISPFSSVLPVENMVSSPISNVTRAPSTVSPFSSYTIISVSVVPSAISSKWSTAKFLGISVQRCKAGSPIRLLHAIKASVTPLGLDGYVAKIERSPFISAAPAYHNFFGKIPSYIPMSKILL